ncbi:transporter substrate-binding domain-containing protein [Paraglaciecola sp.]|uniref:substrate-binding periplasmic protein n=1 Tax=Paraglaciecola sp. TaxID=1920173 RepID=UPI0030F46BF0
MFILKNAKHLLHIKCWLYILLFCCHTVHSKDLLVVAGWNKPPYVISNQESGYEIELIRQALASANYHIVMLYVPYGRTYETMKQEKADIALTLNASSGVPPEILSNPYVTYQNVAISLKKNNIKLKQLSDLHKFSVIAFQSASKVLGEEFAKTVNSNLLYIELPDQRRQVEMLLLGSVDVVVMDVNIFNYFSHIILGENQMDKVTVYAFFPATYYSAAIQDPELKATFNAAMSDFKLTENYRQLRSKYDIIYPIGFSTFGRDEYRR